MKLIYLLAALSTVWATSPLHASTIRNWPLVWSDEFDYEGPLDSARWEYQTGGGGWGNNELENYTTRVENVRVHHGYLTIEAKRENFAGDTFTSGRVNTVKLDGWLYGRVEVRAKLPKGVGTWPAIWMMPSKIRYGDTEWPDNGEMDLMEHVGRDPGHILCNFYTKNLNWMKDTGKGTVYDVPTADAKFHVYALQWTAEEGTYFIDGVPVYTYKNPHTDWGDWPFDQKYYLILNLAMGGFGGDVDPKVNSAKMVIDWVRVYQPPAAVSGL